ncbi:MAG: extracellular solute-binding protein [Clostridia bacterium]|nr:extracellular solute-binding protein [Clostridia bacterium]
MKKLFALLLILTLTLTAASAFAADESLEQTGKLTLYTSASQAWIDNFIPAFEEATGITVDVQTGKTGELMSRIANEAENPYADIIIGAGEALINASAEYFQPYVSPYDAELPEAFHNKSGLFSKTNTTFSVLLVNTDLIGDIRVEGYADLLNPALKGRIAAGDPGSSTASFNHLVNMLWAMSENHDPITDPSAAWEYIDKFTDQLNGIEINSSSAVHQGVASGEYLVGVSYENPGLEYMEAGAPIRVVYMEEGVVPQNSGAAIVKDCKNLYSAQKLVDFMQSEEGQTITSLKTYGRALLPSVETPAFKCDMSTLPLLEIDVNWAQNNTDALIEQYQDIFTK